MFIPEDFPKLDGQRARFDRALAVLPGSDHERIRSALTFAERSHEGQVRAGRSRNPYIIHPIRVACSLVDEYGERDSDAFIAALFHDVVEDCGVTLDVVGRQFGATVQRYVAALTWPKVGRPEKWAFAAAMLRQPRLVRLVKASDIIDNARATWDVDDRELLLQWIYGFGHWGRMIVESIGAPGTFFLDAALQKTTTYHFAHDADPDLRPNDGKALTAVISRELPQPSGWLLIPGDPKPAHRGRAETEIARYPIHTHVVTSEDAMLDLVRRYAVPYLRPADLLAISERIVAITQGRAFPIAEIVPSSWAKFLVRFVHKSKYGIGLGSPWTMELAIREAGLPRILFAAVVGAAAKVFGIRGMFYRVVGRNIHAIDGPCDYTLPPYNGYAKLGPKDPNGVAVRLAREVGVDVAIIDANDLGVNVLGASEGVDRAFVREAFCDNPLGQTREQTPMAIVRKVPFNGEHPR